MISRLANSPKIMTLAAVLCFIHCLITPILIPLIPTISHYFESHVIEYLLIFLSILFGYFIIDYGYAKHRQLKMKVLFFVGSFIWILHLIFEFLHLAFAHMLLFTGSFFVLIAYIYNYSCLKQCKHSCCS